MKLDQEKPSYDYVKLENGEWTDGAETGAVQTLMFDGEALVPINTSGHFSPFMSTAWLPTVPQEFRRHQAARHLTASRFWPQVKRLLVHLENQRWDLFDQQLAILEFRADGETEVDRIRAAFRALEVYGFVWRKDIQGIQQRVAQRICYASSISQQLAQQIVTYFVACGKDQTLMRELASIRQRWSCYFSFLAPVFNTFYWEEDKNCLDDWTLSQKRFDELKQFYVDGFETLCRTSVIAAGIEGVILSGAAGVPSSKRVLTLAEFDSMNNGSKPDLLKPLAIGDLFISFIDNKLRNGIGHHSAHYDVSTDTIEYAVENAKGLQRFTIPYIRFCERIVNLYCQLEGLAVYVHWVRKAALGLPLP